MSDAASISREELRSWMERGDTFLLFEVLPEPYYRKHHLPGALHMPPNDVRGTIERSGASKDSKIVLYCWDDH